MIYRNAQCIYLDGFGDAAGTPGYTAYILLLVLSIILAFPALVVKEFII